MVRRAFRGAFSPDELDDIYASAWVGTLRALADRHAKLADDEIRSYVLTAVANQAGKELRRRKRKPTAPLELVGAVADHGDSPEELASSAEQSRVTRDLLASLPPQAARRDVASLRVGPRAEPGMRADQGSFTARVSQGDHARCRRAHRTDAGRRARKLVQRSRAGAEGVCRRSRRCRPSAAGAGPPRSLSALLRVRRSARRSPPRRGRSGGGHRGNRRHRRPPRAWRPARRPRRTRGGTRLQGRLRGCRGRRQSARDGGRGPRSGCRRRRHPGEARRDRHGGQDRARLRRWRGGGDGMRCGGCGSVRALRSG